MLIKKGKYLISSQPARNLIHALPENITLPDLTAIWKNYFRKVKDSAMSIDEVINLHSGRYKGNYKNKNYKTYLRPKS